jgi:hypothetical protein
MSVIEISQTRNDDLSADSASAKLYFMSREFQGLCLGLDEAIESSEIQLLFADSWYWLHYRFFNCRDMICSETSSVVRTHLYNLVAYLYRSFESLPEKIHRSEAEFLAIIAETIEIAEASRDFPVSLWIHGDQTSKDFLDEWLAPLPSKEQIEHVLKLPHFRSIELERLPYRFDSEKQAMKRFRNELAVYNKRVKLAVKNQQRSSASGESNE